MSTAATSGPPSTRRWGLLAAGALIVLAGMVFWALQRRVAASEAAPPAASASMPAPSIEEPPHFATTEEARRYLSGKVSTEQEAAKASDVMAERLSAAVTGASSSHDAEVLQERVVEFRERAQIHRSRASQYQQRVDALHAP